MIFGTVPMCKKFNDVVIRFEDTSVTLVTCAKHLGMMLDPQLNFHQHVEYLPKKTIGKIKLLARLN